MLAIPERLALELTSLGRGDLLALSEGLAASLFVNTLEIAATRELLSE